jgi:hypothetical protein
MAPAAKRTIGSYQPILRARRGRRRTWRCAGAPLLLAAGLITAAQVADESKDVELRNLSSATLTQLYVSPAGLNAFGPDQIALVPKGAVDHDKTLKLTGVAPGRYDFRLTDSTGRICWLHNIALKANKVVSLRDKDLTDCTP